jgi:hypothetical protein
MAKIDDILPSALEARKTSAELEAEKASEYMRAREAAEAEKRELLDRLQKPSGITDEERFKRAADIIKRAVSNGLLEVELARFPNALCTDRGRAINQMETGWPDTLTGLPKEVYQFWKTHLEPSRDHAPRGAFFARLADGRAPAIRPAGSV